MPQSSAHCPSKTPLRSARNHVSIDPARDRVDLAAERRDPPRVDHVPLGRRHVQLDRPSLRDAEAVDRDDAVRVAVLPRELRAGHLDLEVLLAGARRRDVLDPGELDEDEGGDDHEQEDGERRPGELERARPVDLRAVRVARPVAAPVADDEGDQEPFDEQEDPEADERDEPEALRDPLGVRRLGRHRREAAVARTRGCGRCEQRDERAGRDDGLGVEPHAAGIL